MRLDAQAFLRVQGMIPPPPLKTLLTASSNGQRPGPGTHSSGYSDAISEGCLRPALLSMRKLSLGGKGMLTKHWAGKQPLGLRAMPIGLAFQRPW